MKTQSLKLFAMALVLGLAAVFAPQAANAQTKLFFETSFDFHVGKEKLSAGKYELQKLRDVKFLLRNSVTREARLVVFDMPERSKDSDAPQRIVFSRYGETYFLRSFFDRQDADGKRMTESNYEKQIRRGATENGSQLAGNKSKAGRVSIGLTN